MLRRLLAPLCLGLLAAACQTYDFEQVQPLAIAQTTRTRNVAARNLKPNLMLLLDKSGSMSDPDSTGTPKIQALRTAMSGFLGQAKVPARVGLTTFPAADSNCNSNGTCCTPASSVAVGISAPRVTEDDADDKAKAAAVLARINSVNPGGGTPTNLSLQFVGSLPEVQDTGRLNFVLLLTDGLPNCNPSNAVDCTNAAACKCGSSSCGIAGSSTCKLICQDESGSVDAIQQLRAKNIKTIVVGFGADTAGGNASQVLGAMSLAGGFPRACKADADCGSGGCNTTTKACNVPYFQAANGAELATALNSISALIDNGGLPPCVWPLDTTAPVNPALIAVIFGDKNLPQGADTWTYEPYQGSADKYVTFHGNYCAQIEASNPQNPVHVEIRAVEQL